MRKMKDQAIVCNIGHFDNEIQLITLNNSNAKESKLSHSLMNLSKMENKFSFLLKVV